MDRLGPLRRRRQVADLTIHPAEEIGIPHKRFSRVAHRAAAFEGSAWSAASIFAFFVAWLAWGAAIGFPRWWELIVTAGIPFLTLLMLVFLQHRQEHDDRAIQLKLDELIRASDRASNNMMTVEHASLEDLERIQAEFRDQAGS